jgi:hypothetical protein
MKQLISIDSSEMVINCSTGPKKAVEIALSICSVTKELIGKNLEKKFKVKTIEFAMDVPTLDIMLKTLTDIRKGLDK